MTNNIDQYIRERIFQLVSGGDETIPPDKSDLFQELVDSYTEYLIRSVDADAAYMKALTVTKYLDRFGGESPESTGMQRLVNETTADKYIAISDAKVAEAEQLWGEVEAAFQLFVEETPIHPN